MALDAESMREAVMRASSHSDLAHLVQTEVLHQLPHAFLADPALFEEVKSHLSSRLGTDSDAISLVGSAALGYSIAPDNFSRPFHSGSDLDFVVTSSDLFDEVWRVLLRWGHPVRNRIPLEAADWFESRSGEIFWGWLDPEKLRFRGVTRPTLLRSLQRLQSNWWETFQGLGGAFPGTEVAGRKANARLYRSEMHLVQYQANSLKKVKLRLERSGE